jgi:hypothetical protein
VLSPAAAFLAVNKYGSPVRPAEGRRLGEDLSVRKSEVQVLSPAGTFLERGCGAGVEPAAVKTLLQYDRRKTSDWDNVSEHWKE